MASVQQVVMHPYVSQLLKFWQATGGRDKTARTVQYLARFLAYYRYTQGAPKEVVSSYSSVKSSVSQARKIFRVGRFLENLQSALRALNTSDPAVRALTIIRQLGYAVYLFFDMFLAAHGTKLYVFEKETHTRISKTAQRAWAIALSASLISGGYSSYKLLQRQRLAQRPRATAEKEAERRVELKQISTEALGVRLQILQDLCDWLVATTSLGYLGLNDGWVGLAGVVSSSLGVRTQWIKANGAKK